MSDPADPTNDPVLIRLRASAPRRAMAVTVLSALGLLLLWLAATQPAAPSLRLGLGVAGGLAIWGAVTVWRATRRVLVLTARGLREEGGCTVAALSEIVAVDRGTFAFKPSNGFLVRLAVRGARGWAPGLWWRVGRRLGVGGVTSSREARMMADALTALLARRDGQV